MLILLHRLPLALGFLPFTTAVAQGGLGVLPLSAVTTKADDTLSFRVFNYGDTPVRLSFEDVCDLAGRQLHGKECAAAFVVRSEKPIDAGILTLKAKENSNIEVRLRSSNVGAFAIYKPLISPLPATQPTVASALMVMNYQPGLLFLVQPRDEALAAPAFVLEKTGRQKAIFNFDLTSLSIPQEVNVSAKIIEKSTGKLLRFAPLLRNKILDPRRGVLEAVTELKSPAPAGTICAQIFVESKTSVKTYRLDSCAN